MLKRVITSALIALWTFATPAPAIAGVGAQSVNTCDTLPDAVRAFSARHSVSLADAARELVNRNSIHAEGDAFVTSPDPFAMLDLVCRVEAGDAEPPHLLCGHRAGVMQALLSGMGIRARTVYLFSEWNGKEALYGHVFIETLDPDTGRWQIQDPDYNVAYENAGGERLTINHIVAMTDKDEATPVNVTTRGWAETGAEPLLRGNYYSVAYVPSTNMLYYDWIGGGTGLVTRVGEFIKEEMGISSFTSARIGMDNRPSAITATEPEL